MPWTTIPSGGDVVRVRLDPVEVCEQAGERNCQSVRSRSKLRRPDLNRRRTAYETVLETRLQSTPQYSRQDSNLRSTPCEGGAVAAGPRE